MDLLLHPDIIEFFLRIRFSLNKSDRENVLISAINHANNKILISKFWLNELEKYMNSKPELLDIYHNFIKELTDTNFYNKIKSINSLIDNDIEAEIGAIYDNHSDAYILVLCYDKNLKLEKLLDHALIVFTDVSPKPISYGWLKLNFASNNSLSFAYSDFNSRNEINVLFENFFKIKKSLNGTVLHIFNRDYNFSNHSFFSYISNKNYEIKYYSRKFIRVGSSQEMDRTELQNNLREIKRKFCSSNIQYWVTTRQNCIHERKIIYDNLILTVDDDFNNLDIDRATWQITLNCDHIKTTRHLMKCRTFHRIT